jgi:DNA-binding transcriptional ArsR family regulator
MTTGADPVSLCFSALANPARRAIVERLAAGDATLSELAAPLGISLPAVSRHVSVLEGAGLVERVGPARFPRRRLRRVGLRPGAAWFLRQQERWDLRLDRLAQRLASGRRTA